jgi:hypothetical protein
MIENQFEKDSDAPNLDEHLDITNGTIDIKKLLS